MPPPNDDREPIPGRAAAMDRPALPPWVSWPLILGLGAAIWAWDVWLGRRPAEVPPWGWRLLAIFLPTILALMLRPIPGGAAVLLGLIAAVLFDALPPDKPPMETALAGYADPTVWLVLAAYFISRALIKTGLARRIALGFVRLLGHNTLGLSYAMTASDTVLAAMIPSNAARVGGVILPITQSMAELYNSYPGRTAGLLGTFLMLSLYQCDVVACALFLTGQASNPLAAKTAADITAGVVRLSYANWFLYALAPAVVSLLLIPWLLYRWQRPVLRHTPEAVALARAELARMGRPREGEWVVIATFAAVCGGWILTGVVGAGEFGLSASGAVALIALSGVGVLLLSGVLTWEDCVTERGAWDVFIWYGGLVQLGKLLNDAGVTRAFAEGVRDALDGYGLPLEALFVVMLLIYFYAHYAFASITAHIVSMFPPFVAVLLLLGTPPWLVACSFAYFSNFCAGLTHYGTTPAPIVFSTGYVPHGTWWRVGFVVSVVNIAIWLTVGVAWWSLWGLW